MRQRVGSTVLIKNTDDDKAITHLGQGVVGTFCVLREQIGTHGNNLLVSTCPSAGI